MRQNTQRLFSAALGTSLLILSTARLAAATPELRKALLELYPVYSAAELLHQYADECEPNGAPAHQAAYDRWLQTHRLTGVRDLLRQQISAQEYRDIEQAEQNQLRPKLRRAFPKCIDRALLEKIYSSAKMDPRNTNTASLATIQTALVDRPTPPGKPTNPGTPKPPAPTPPITPPSNPNSAALEGIYLSQTTGFSGVGGGVSLNFTSYAVFQDGTISSDLNAALGGTGDRNPKRWGQWQRHGNGFKVTWNNGKTSNLGGKLFYKTFAATPGDTIQGKYLSIGGGGNTALGGNVLTASWKNITFDANGRFEQGGSKQGGPAVSGNYSLDGHAIELRYPNGSVIRTGFYFFPSKGQKSADSIAIGNTIYSRR
jgi:hypothetical protein